MTSPFESHNDGPSQEHLGRPRSEAAACTRCHLYENATQTVFGVGPPVARVMFVGEQPDDKEDIVGTPLIGPVGRLFNQVLDDA